MMLPQAKLNSKPVATTNEEQRLTKGGQRCNQREKCKTSKKFNSEICQKNWNLKNGKMLQDAHANS